MPRGKKINRPSPASSNNLMRQAKTLPFAPAVVYENNECVIRLPELGLVATGENYEAAKAALLEEVRSYSELYLTDDDLKRDPTRRNHFRLVSYAQKADEKGMLGKLVFAPLNTKE